MTSGFDRILEQVGSWGRYQKIKFVLLTFICAFPASYGLASSIFMIMPPFHWCKPPDILPPPLQNLTQDHLKKVLIPEEFNHQLGIVTNSSCKMRNATLLAELWDVFSDERTLNPAEMFNLTIVAGDTHDLLVPCQNGWSYDPFGKWTLISEWDLVCANNYFGHLLLTINSLGRILGTIVFSALQDYIGRKPTMFIVLTWYIVFGALGALMPTITAYIAMSTIRSLAGIAIFQVPYILCTELVGYEKNTFVVNVMSMVFATAFATVAFVAWLVPSWKHLQLASTLPWIIFFIFWFFIDESPRWLLSKKKKEKAVVILHKIAETNGNPFSEEQLQGLVDEAEKEEILEKRKKEDDDAKAQHPLILLFKHQPLCLLSFVMACLWCVNAMVYIGISMNTQNFGGNPYIVFALIALVEIPSEFFNFIVDYAGRVWPSAITMTISGLALLAASATPLKMVWVTICFVVLSKFCITASFCTLYQIGTELFPTVVRGTGIGFATTISQILGLVTPFVVYSATTMRILPTLILGSLSLSGGILTLFLPETLNAVLPDTIEDVVGRKMIGMSSFLGNLSFKDLKIMRQRKRKRSVLLY